MQINLHDYQRAHDERFKEALKEFFDWAPTPYLPPIPKEGAFNRITCRCGTIAWVRGGQNRCPDCQAVVEESAALHSELEKLKTRLELEQLREAVREAREQQEPDRQQELEEAEDAERERFEAALVRDLAPSRPSEAEEGWKAYVREEARSRMKLDMRPPRKHNEKKVKARRS